MVLTSFCFYFRFIFNLSAFFLGISSVAVGRHRLTIGTCNSIGPLISMQFPKGHFTHFVIDEAGQTVEPEIMIPLSIMDNFDSQIILAGKFITF